MGCRGVFPIRTRSLNSETTTGSWRRGFVPPAASWLCCWACRRRSAIFVFPLRSDRAFPLLSSACRGRLFRLAVALCRLLLMLAWASAVFLLVTGRALLFPCSALLACPSFAALSALCLLLSLSRCLWPSLVASLLLSPSCAACGSPAPSKK